MKPLGILDPESSSELAPGSIRWQALVPTGYGDDLLFGIQ
jgi:hypothetical protein